MQPLRDAALPLIATLLPLTIEPSTAEFDPGEFDGEAGAAVSFLPEASVTVGQSLPEPTDPGEGEDDGRKGRTLLKGPSSLSRRHPRPGSRSLWGWTRPWISSAATTSTSF